MTVLVMVIICLYYAALQNPIINRGSDHHHEFPSVMYFSYHNIIFQLTPYCAKCTTYIYIVYYEVREMPTNCVADDDDDDDDDAINISRRRDEKPNNTIQYNTIKACRGG